MRTINATRTTALAIWFCGAVAILAAGLLHTAPPAVAEPTTAPSSTPPAPAAAVVDDAAIDDSAQLLGNARQPVLEAMRTFSADTNMTITVVTTKDTGGQAIQVYATARAAQLGRDRGEAVVFGIDMGGRQTGIYTTPAAQAKLPDEVLESVVAEILRPALKDGRYSQGLVDGINRLTDHLNPPDKTWLVSVDDGPISGWTICWLVVFGGGLYGLSQLIEWSGERRERRARIAAVPAKRRDSLRKLEPTLGELSSDQARFKKAQRETGVSRDEWNVLYPNWWIYAAAINASNSSSTSPAAESGGHSSSSRSSRTDTSSSYSNYSSFDSGSSSGGFDGGGGATGGF